MSRLRFTWVDLFLIAAAIAAGLMAPQIEHLMRVAVGQ